METGNIILINGQSNSLAYGTTGIPFPGWVPNPKIQIWSVAHQTFEVYVPGGHADWPGAWGPEAQYVLERSAAAPDETFFIVKQVGGAIADLVPTFPTGHWQVFITQIVCARSLIIALGFTPKPDVFLLVGGETDGQNWPTGGALFRYNLSTLLSSARIALGAPKMRVVISRIYPMWDLGGVVRDAQVSIGCEPFNAWVDVDDVSKADPGHSNAAGTIEVGHRMYLADRLR